MHRQVVNSRPASRRHTITRPTTVAQNMTPIRAVAEEPRHDETGYDLFLSQLERQKRRNNRRFDYVATELSPPSTCSRDPTLPVPLLFWASTSTLPLSDEKQIMGENSNFPPSIF